MLYRRSVLENWMSGWLAAKVRSRLDVIDRLFSNALGFFEEWGCDSDGDQGIYDTWSFTFGSLRWFRQMRWLDYVWIENPVFQS